MNTSLTTHTETDLISRNDRGEIYPRWAERNKLRRRNEHGQFFRDRCGMETRLYGVTVIRRDVLKVSDTLWCPGVEGGIKNGKAGSERSP